MEIPLLIFIGLANFCIGLFVLLNNPKNIVNRSFFTLILVVSLWPIVLAGVLSARDAGQLLVFSRMMMAGPVFIPAALLFFTSHFTRMKIPAGQPLSFLLYCIVPLVFFMLTPTDFFIISVNPEPWGIRPLYGQGYYYFALYVWSYFSYSFYLLYKKYKVGDSRTKNKIFYFVIGALIPTFIGSLANIILPLFGITQFNKIGPFSTIIFALFTSYSITKHRLMDIRMIISSLSSYFIVFAAYLIGLLCSVYLFSMFFTIGFNAATIIFFYALIILAGLSFHPIRLHLKTGPDRFLFKKQSLNDQTYKDLTEYFNLVHDRKKILDQFSLSLSKNLKTKNIRFFWFDD